MVLSLGCVKKYNEKVVRAAQGMLFKVNVVTKDFEMDNNKIAKRLIKMIMDTY